MSAKTYPVSRYYSFTPADEAILSRMSALRRIEDAHLPETTLVQPPIGSKPFIRNGSLAISALAVDTSYTLLQYSVPEGYRGVLTNVSFWLDGANLANASGVLTWSLSLGDGFVLDYGNVNFTIAPDFTAAMTGRGGELLLPNQVLAVTLRTGSDLSSLLPDGIVNARLKGWYVPA